MYRYATIITDADGQEIVSAVGQFEGAASLPRLGCAEQVAPGVKIGMVRDAVGGFDRLGIFSQKTVDGVSAAMLHFCPWC
ncbi:MAG: hypothetical protein EOR97_24550 [Mesorhizobium sp.]|uniref:hypothetical protein n=1 Tax=Mesorhizobium sp. TaxID=1871066 RepID=UPI000FD408A8|nr:hypothetical protein [Mesorhizobium sp.]RUV08506.1 hypothetical protein EOD00_18715 [Mesorhizobium sp. M7A.T.Ca.TU.009.01.3.1]RWN27750.1 MAG: hypothetical protein EOR97_24550 [Mesorhizobium sp.]